MISEVFGKGLYEQMKNVEVNKDCYNNFTLEMLTQFAKDISECSTERKAKIHWPKLTKEQIGEYKKVLKLVKSGYLYQVQNDARMVLTTGYEGIKRIIKQAIKNNNPPDLFIPEIWIIDDERNIMVQLMNIRWIKKSKEE